MSLPPDVLRVKGVVRLDEEPDCWYQFQRVDEFRGEAALFQLPQKPIVPACAVLIGVKLDETLIRQRLKESAKDLDILPA
jgi:G3E family GTPase